MLPLLSSQKYLAVTFSNTIVKILDYTLTLFKSSNKDTSTSAAVEYNATLRIRKICVAAVDIEKHVTHGSYQSNNFLQGTFHYNTATF